MLRSILRLAVGSLLLTGCNTVSVDKPIGDAVDLAEQQQLVGIWANEAPAGDANRFVLRVARNRAGELVMASLNWNDELQDYKLETAEIVATELGDMRLLHFRAASKSKATATGQGEEQGDDGAENRYQFFRYQLQGENKAQVWVVKPTKFHEAVKSGQLPGEIKQKQGSNAYDIRCPAPDVADYLQRVGAEACFDREPNLIMERISSRP